VLSRSIEGIAAEDLFAAALALPSIERDRYLKRACSSDTGLLNRLMDLVNAFGDASSFVTGDALCDTDRVGPYRLLRELGEGGCGIAYLADQSKPVKRQVALKVIKPGMDTKAVIVRFEAERQALALMDHPNVAKVFDAGTTLEGRPYFVMELVRGIRITEYCTQSRLTVPERLSLFIQVCQAIQHAHQKGIIHRDIKPSNVLVTMHDGLPLAKVIDFGIAKATRGRLTDHTLHTHVDQIMGTPAYISPEQTGPAQVAVDTRSDIYSLGSLLYELLTGRTPLDPNELAEVGIDQLRHKIVTEEPSRPSVRLESLSEEILQTLSRQTGTTSLKLIKQVRDDLDWIVMQCLEKHPSRRYQTVSELVADLDRHLRGEPVHARPPSVARSVCKFARRHRIAFAFSLSVSMFLLAMTVLAVTMTVQAQRIAEERDRAEREKQRAEKTANVALNVVAIADPFHSRGNDVTAATLLQQAATSIKHELADQPGPRARLLQAVGRAYVRRGEFRPAIDYLRDAVPLLHQIPGAEGEALLTMIDLSSALRMSGDWRGARAVLMDGVSVSKQSGLEQSAAHAKLILNVGRVELEEGRISDAQRHFETSLRLYQRTAGTRSVEAAEALAELAQTSLWNDNIEEAEQSLREALAIFETTVPPMYPDRIVAEIRLTEVLYLQNRLDDASRILESALEKNAELYGRRSLEVVDVLDRLAMVRYSQRRLDEAEALSREAVASCAVARGLEHADTASMEITLARTLIEVRKYMEAEALLRRALKTLAATLPPDHQYVASAEYFLGDVLLSTDRPAEAESVLLASMNRWKRANAPAWRAMRSTNALGEALYRQGRIAEAEEYLSESLRELSADAKADHAAKDKAQERARLYLRTTAPSR
jgi:eukaryotic-like serine/threonine-protein kinase